MDTIQQLQVNGFVMALAIFGAFAFLAGGLVSLAFRK